MPHVTKISAGGRVVIPAEYRKALGLKTGDQLLADLEDGEVRLVTKARARKRAQELVCRLIPKERSLVDELLAERRIEAGRE